MDATTRDRIPVALLIAATALGVAVAAWAATYQVDDAFITYRYARNLAGGQGPVFNPGGPAAEGFSSPAWCLLLTVAAWIGGATVLPVVSAVLGAIAAAACCAAGYRAARPGGLGAACLGTALMATLPTLTFYATAGLETPLFLLVVLGVAGATAGRVPRWWGLCAAAAAFWVRPEAGWLPVAVIAQIAAGRIRRDRRLAGLAVAWFAGGTLLLAGRLLLFGQPLPLTFHAKPGSTGVGWDYLVDRLTEPAAAGLLVLGILGGILGGPRQRGFLGAATAWLILPLVEGGDWMPGARFLLPAMGLLALAAGGLAEPMRARRWRPAPIWLAVALAVGFQVHEGWRLAERVRDAEQTYRREARFIADWVDRSGAESVAAVDIGWLGYRVDAEILDLGGLTDPEIGLLPGDHLAKAIEADGLLRERRPDVIVLRLDRPPERHGAGELLYHPIEEVERRILGSGVFARDYRRAFMVFPHDLERRPFYGRAIFVRRGFTVAPGAELPDRIIQLDPPS